LQTLFFLEELLQQFFHIHIHVSMKTFTAQQTNRRVVARGYYSRKAKGQEKFPLYFDGYLEYFVVF
jgi:hypothetical protein